MPHVDDLETEESWPLLARFREYGTPHVHLLIVSLIAIFAASLLTTSVPTIIGVAIDAMFNAEPYRLPVIPDTWIPTDPSEQLWFTAGLLAVVYVLSFPLGFSGNYFRSLFSEYLQYDLKMDAYDTIQRLEVAFFEDQQTGEIMSILNNDVDNLEQFFNYTMASLVRNITTITAMAIYMSFLNWHLTIVTFTLVPVFMYTGRRFGSRFEQVYEEVQRAMGKMNARFEGNIGGMTVIKAHTAEEFESARVQETSEEMFRTNWNAIKLRQQFYPVMHVLSNGTFLLTAIVGGYWVLVGLPGPLDGALTAGQLVPFLLYSQQLSGRLGALLRHVEIYKSAKASANRIAKIHRTDITIEEAENASELDEVDGYIEAENVSFSYGDQGDVDDDDLVLDAVSFEADPGETIGIVGSTGSGKSTLTKLLMRFYDVDSGHLRIDGHDIRDVTLQSLRDNIGYVAQEPYLFSGTVQENIAYGTPEAAEAQIREAARAAQAHEFIDTLEDGYETEVGGRGVKLSGGQRQRIAIARAVVRDPAIMIFDEATSHVDNETEVLIQHSLAEITENRTTFVVAHRLSTVRNADEILVVDDGHIVERGTHDELLAVDGQYATLWGVQVGLVDSLPESVIDDSV